MPEERASGIIVRVRPYSDTSLIVHWLTAEQGRVVTLAKGARQPKSPFQGKLDLLFAGDLSYISGRRSLLHTLREFLPRIRYSGVRADYGKLVQAAYGVVLLERETETDTPVPELYNLFTAWVEYLEGHPPQPRTVYAFEARLLELLGLDPGAATEGLRPESKELLLQLLTVEWVKLPSLVASGATVRQVSEFLRRRLVEAFGSVPTSRTEAVKRNVGGGKVER